MAKGKKTGGGSRLGKPNRATTDVRAAIALIAQRNVEKVDAWLEQIADPAKRVGLFLDLCEYYIPKLQRTEIANADDKPFKQKHEIAPGDAMRTYLDMLKQ